MLSNQEIAEIFYNIADILEIQAIEFKPQAYRKAAKHIESLSKSVYTIYKEKGLKGLDNIPGVGKHISLKIEEIIKTGKLPYLTKLKKQLPKGVYKLMDVQSLGPRKVSRLYKELKIKNITDLKKAIKKHKVAELKGFGLKSEIEILEGLKLNKQSKQRMLLGEAYPIAYEIKNELSKLHCIEKINIVGSLARMKETIKDIDILCISKKPNKVINEFTKLGKKVLAKGKTKSSIILQNNLQVDLRVLPKKQYGSSLQYFIGSKQHSVHLRQIAIKKEYKLSEYGLFTRKGKLIESKDEKKIYNKLGLQWVPYELRENTGEIEAAMNNKLPKLIKYNEIKGDLHMHTTYSDGGHSVWKMADFCKTKLKYEYVAITDHSKSQKIANGMEVKELLKQIKEIDKLNKKYNKFKIFKSCEVDIKGNGTLDYKKSILSKLDVVTASIHSGFKNNNTPRLLKAMDNRYVKIIGHPTGRLINARNPYPLDIEKVFQKAKDNDIWIEINAHPQRLDINDIYIKKAIEMKVKMVINTDAHSVDGLHNMVYGIAQARRGWATQKDIINTLSLKKFEKLL
tara:strand:- start:9671 stop:11374 length:1704 start_codon:yes stop_codon:yes gene_type:complete